MLWASTVPVSKWWLTVSTAPMSAPWLIADATWVGRATKTVRFFWC